MAIINKNITRKALVRARAREPGARYYGMAKLGCNIQGKVPSYEDIEKEFCDFCILGYEIWFTKPNTSCIVYVTPESLEAYLNGK